MEKETVKRGSIWGKVALWTLAILGAAGLFYLSAASTLGFRLWMGDRNIKAHDYPSAILWYTRALRLVQEGQDSLQITDISSRLYRAYEGFCRWEFDGDRLWGWFAGNQINELLLNKGVLEVSSTGEDPWLEILRLRLAPNRSYRFEVRMRVQGGSRGRIYWAPLTDVFDSKHVGEFPLPSDGDWHEYIVELTPIKEEIGKLRFIPANAAGRIAIDWIRILPS